MAREIQDLGFDSARLVVDRFVDLFNGFLGQTGTKAGSPGSYLHVLRGLAETSTAVLGGATSQPGATDDLALPDVVPGGRSSKRLWIHNTSSSAAANLRPWTPGMTSHTGESIPPGAVTFIPARVERLDPGESREIIVTAIADQGTSFGAYHGQILVEGLPDVAFSLRLDVVPAPAPS